MKSTKSKTAGKTKIKYGKVSLPDDAFNTKETKFRVTMYIDLDVLDEVRKLAKDSSLPYQTYINQMLREQTLGSKMEDRIRKIVRDEIKKTG
jgi:hypothetical protein